MGKPNVNINVGGAANGTQTYKIVVLKPNIPFAQQLSNEDTIYVIKWDYDLGGEEVTVPANCVLEFDGGSLSNGIIVGDGTIVNGKPNCLIRVNVKGTYANTSVFSDWVYIDGNNNTDKLQNGLNLCNGNVYSVFNIIDGNYQIQCKGVDEESHYTDGGIHVPGNTTVEFNGSILTCIPNDSEGYSMITVSEDNVVLNNGNLIGDVEEHLGTAGEWGYGVHIIGVHNVILKDIKCSYFWGDGINITSKLLEDDGVDSILRLPENITIERCTCSNNRRQGASVISCIGLKILDSKFTDTGKPEGTNPKSGIDFEQNWYNNEIIDDIYIEGCVFTGNSKGICINDKLSMENCRTFNIYVTNCVFDNTCQFRTKEDSSIVFNNCTFNGWLQFTDGNIGFTDCVFHGQFHLVGIDNILQRNSVFTFDKCELDINNCYYDYCYIYKYAGIIGRKEFLFKNTLFHFNENGDVCVNVVKVPENTNFEGLHINYLGCNFIEDSHTGMLKTFLNIQFTDYIIGCRCDAIQSIVLYRHQGSKSKYIENNNIRFSRKNSNRDAPYFVFDGNGEYENTRDIVITKNILLLNSTQTPLFVVTNYNASNKLRLACTNNTGAVINDKTREEWSYFVINPGEQEEDTATPIIKSSINHESDGYKGAIGMDVSNKNKLLFHNGSGWFDATGRTPNKNAGTTSDRPSNLQPYDIGYCYMDTTIGKPIFWIINTEHPDGTWVDATGTEV